MTQPVLDDVRLVGERAALRPTRRGDAADVYLELAGDTGIFDWILWDGPTSIEDLAERYGRWRRTGPAGVDYSFAITDPNGDEMRGTLSARFSQSPYIGDVGYLVLTKDHGRGLATDAIRLASHLCFTHLAAQLMTAEVMVGNERSARALERVGFERAPEAPTTRSLGIVPGEALTKADRPMWTYTLTRRQFDARQPGWKPVSEHVVLQSDS